MESTNWAVVPEVKELLAMLLVFMSLFDGMDTENTGIEYARAAVDRYLMPLHLKFSDLLRPLEGAKKELDSGQVNLSAERKQLEEDKKQLEEDKKQLEEDKKQLEDDKKQLEDDKKEVEKDKKKLDAAKRANQDLIEELNAGVEKWTEDQRKLSAERTKTSDDREAALERILNRITDATSNMDKAANRLGTSSKSIDKATISLNVASVKQKETGDLLKTDLTKLNTSIEGVEGLHSSLETASTRLKAAIASAASKVESINVPVDEFTVALQSVRTPVETLVTSVEHATTKVVAAGDSADVFPATLQSGTAALEMSINSKIDGNIRRFGAGVAGTIAKFESLKDQIDGHATRFGKAVDAAVPKVDGFHAPIQTLSSKLQGVVESTKSENERLGKSIKDMVATLDSGREAVDLIKTPVKNLVLELKKASGDVAAKVVTLEEPIDSLKVAFGTANKELVRIEDPVSRFLVKFNAGADQVDDQLRVLKKASGDVAAKVVTLEEPIDSLKVAFGTANKELGRIEDPVSRLLIKFNAGADQVDDHLRVLNSPIESLTSKLQHGTSKVGEDFTSLSATLKLAESKVHSSKEPIENLARQLTDKLTLATEGSTKLYDGLLRATENVSAKVVEVEVPFHTLSSKVSEAVDQVNRHLENLSEPLKTLLEEYSKAGTTIGKAAGDTKGSSGAYQAACRLAVTELESVINNLSTSSNKLSQPFEGLIDRIGRLSRLVSDIHGNVQSSNFALPRAQVAASGALEGEGSGQLTTPVRNVSFSAGKRVGEGIFSPERSLANKRARSQRDPEVSSAANDPRPAASAQMQLAGLSRRTSTTLPTLTRRSVLQKSSSGVPSGPTRDPSQAALLSRGSVSTLYDDEESSEPGTPRRRSQPASRTGEQSNPNRRSGESVSAIGVRPSAGIRLQSIVPDNVQQLLSTMSDNVKNIWGLVELPSSGWSTENGLWLLNNFDEYVEKAKVDMNKLDSKRSKRDPAYWQLSHIAPGNTLDRCAGGYKNRAYTVKACLSQEFRRKKTIFDGGLAAKSQKCDNCMQSESPCILVNYAEGVTDPLGPRDAAGKRISFIDIADHLQTKENAQGKRWKLELR